MTWFTDMRPTAFTRFDPATGEVLEVGNMTIGGVRYLERENGGSYLVRPSRLGLDYVDLSRPLAGPTIVERTPCPAWVDGAALADLPAPCVVTVTDEAGAQTVIDCDTPDLALGFDFPGTYAIRVSSVPHLDGEFTLEA